MNAVVNYASHGWFLEAQQRLADSLARYDPASQHCMYGPQQIDPAAFPSYRFKLRAIMLSGAPRILWLDAANYLTKPIEAIWRDIARQGYAIQWNDPACKLGIWSSDHALEVFGITRNEAMGLPDCAAGLIGLNLEHPAGWAIYGAWRGAMLQGVFDGPRSNREGQCSSDPRCKGHRQDQTALSLILHKLKLAAAPWETYYAFRPGTLAPVRSERMA